MLRSVSFSLLEKSKVYFVVFNRKEMNSLPGTVTATIKPNYLLVSSKSMANNIITLNNEKRHSFVIEEAMEKSFIEEFICDKKLTTLCIENEQELIGSLCDASSFVIGEVRKHYKCLPLNMDINSWYQYCYDGEEKRQVELSEELINAHQIDKEEEIRCNSDLEATKENIDESLSSSYDLNVAWLSQENENNEIHMLNSDMNETMSIEEITALLQKYTNLIYVIEFSQPQSISLLKYHITWLKNDCITDDQYQWIIGLLLKLDSLLISSDIFILRQLCRKCLDIRMKLIDDNEYYSNQASEGTLNSKKKDNLSIINVEKGDIKKQIHYLNYIIIIIAKIYGQYDLIL